MSETKDEIAAERDQLRAENEQLRGQLTTAGVPRLENEAAPRRPFLSEGERQELETYGVTNSPFTGQRLQADEVRAELATSDDQQGVEIGEAAPGLAREVPPTRERTPIEGVDYVWPSVAPGVLADDVKKA
ncbi:hypothetical protein [Micromonospora mirobrigensis]|uniref:Uncharacterized protein n=1 Tax=Micromonospora mirobrigensis TaxID=262898 RepID=A0A1C4YPN8_9ACTN|nr:hypothetical protein [Micromonospora mirobrigensis]SCF22654.1 hypothetical protein GA0070564_104265 [Micromonospora mirobrigensis]